MITELAVYERSADQVMITVDQLWAALFGPSSTASCLIAEHEGGVVGFALYFGYFSTWQGQGLYLEDLYVRPEVRGTGFGLALLRSLAMITTSHGYARLEWAVLNWNAPSIAFYDALGALPQDEWTRYRLTGPALAALAAPAAPDDRS